jgi:hypothetical protein
MEKKNPTLALASLAAAASLLGSQPAQAQECISCEPVPPGSADFVFGKIEPTFNELLDKFSDREYLFFKFYEIFYKLESILMKE